MSAPARLVPDQQPPPRVYSYIRMSTPEQRRGNSFRRQTETAQRWAEADGLELDTSLNLNDEGVSAFRGANASDGALGRFLEYVRAGDVPKGSVLFVENLDRISRETAWDAVNTLRRIIESDVEVVVGSDQRRLTRESVRSDGGMSLLMATVTFMRAHDESKAKSMRLRAVWSAKRERARETKAPMTGRIPAWLKREGNAFVVQKQRAAVVRRIFDLSRRGVGMDTIARRLTEEQVAPFGGGRLWNKSAVSKILSNPAVVGTMVPHEVVWDDAARKKVRRPVGEPVQGYFPAVVSEQVWQAVQLYRGKRSVVPGQHETRNLFGGLLRCAKCGAALTRRDKGERSKPKLVCMASRYGKCDAPRLDYAAFEARALAALPALLSDVQLLAGGSLHADIQETEAEAAACDAAMARIVSAIERGAEAPALTHRLTELQRERDAYSAKLAQLRSESDRVASPAFHRVSQWLSSSDLSANREATSLRLRTAIRAVRVDTAAGRAEVEWTGGESVSTFTLNAAN